MISSKPVEDKSVVEKIIRDYCIPADNNPVILDFTDGEVSSGYIALYIVEDTVYFQKFILTNEYSDFEKKFYLDFLMRSAASYAENRGIKKMVNLDNVVDDLLLKKGFKMEGGAVTAPISLVVHYN